MDFANDIPLELARRAHAGTSFVPDTRGNQERASYAATLASDYADLERHATTDDKRATLAEEFARYREGYGRRYRDMLAAKSRTMSTMITGGSNFPTARNRKRGAVADKRTTDLVEYRERALAAIRKKLRPELAPIMAGDDDAVTRLREKITKAEALQERMKAVNVAIRKHAKAGPDAQIAAIVALGYTESAARAALAPDFAGRIGIADYQLKNNNAEIRRLKTRLEGITKAKSTPDTMTEGESARIEESAADNRIRLFFPGKPSADVRARLKSAGFRWSPTIEAWQAYINNHTRTVARAIAGAPETAIDAAATFIAAPEAP